ncbi:hypothetical protein GCM10027426_11380 [Microbacterium lacusdiani]
MRARGDRTARVGDHERDLVGVVREAARARAHHVEVLDGDDYIATHIHASDRFITEWLE